MTSSVARDFLLPSDPSARAIALALLDGLRETDISTASPLPVHDLTGAGPNGVELPLATDKVPQTPGTFDACLNAYTASQEQLNASAPDRGPVAARTWYVAQSITSDATPSMAPADGKLLFTPKLDDILDPESPRFRESVLLLGALERIDTEDYVGLLEAIARRRRAYVKQGAGYGSFSTLTLAAAQVEPIQAQRLLESVMRPVPSGTDAERFRAHMFAVMAEQSVEDGLTLVVRPRTDQRPIEPIYATKTKSEQSNFLPYHRTASPFTQGIRQFPTARCIILVSDEHMVRSIDNEMDLDAGLFISPTGWLAGSFLGQLRYAEIAADSAHWRRYFPPFVSTSPSHRDFQDEVACRSMSGILAHKVQRELINFEEAGTMLRDYMGRSEILYRPSLAA